MLVAYCTFSLCLYACDFCLFLPLFRDGLGSLFAQCQQQNAMNEEADAKAKDRNTLNSQVPQVNPTSNISIPKLPLRTSGDKW